MECSICYDEITKDTGVATLVCGHPFHLGCIGRWIMKNESCPCCRKEMTEKERILEDEEEDSEMEEEEEYEENDEDENDECEIDDSDIEEGGISSWIKTPYIEKRLRVQVKYDNDTDEEEEPLPYYDEEAHAFWEFRNMFAQLNESTDFIENLKADTTFKNMVCGADRTDILRMRHRQTDPFAARDWGYESA